MVSARRVRNSATVLDSGTFGIEYRLPWVNEGLMNLIATVRGF